MPANTETQDPLLVAFASFEDATLAQQQLVAAGVPREQIVYRSLQDEAGPVDGNFLIGNGKTVHGGEPDAVLAGREVPYDENFRRTVTRGAHLLALAGLQGPQREQARAVLARFDAVLVEDAAAGG